MACCSIRNTCKLDRVLSVTLTGATGGRGINSTLTRHDLSTGINVTHIFIVFLSLANVTFTFAICCPRPSVCLSSVGNARALYLGGCNFRQYLYGIWYAGHPLTSTKNFTFYGDRPRGPPPPGELNTTGVTKYSNF